ncbi:MAG: hypothetical protein ACREQ3_24380 [Candidatus Binatia bacterium]
MSELSTEVASFATKETSMDIRAGSKYYTSVLELTRIYRVQNAQANSALDINVAVAACGNELLLQWYLAQPARVWRWSWQHRVLRL